MIEGSLFRHVETNGYTIGFLVFEGCETVFATLELPDRGNQVKVSRILSGRYIAQADNIGKFQWWKLLGVIGRSFIEIHQGNTVSDTMGCLLVGLYAEGSSIFQSIKALKILKRFVGDKDWILNIYDVQTKQDIIKVIHV